VIEPLVATRLAEAAAIMEVEEEAEPEAAAQAEAGAGAARAGPKMVSPKSSFYSI
jgi:hypothetical protein